MLSILVAVNHKNTIGLNGKMPWRNKEDLYFFRRMTLNQTILMGRKTFEGLPQTLDNRNILIVSRDQSYNNVIPNFKDYLNKHENSEEEIFVCGGGEVYKVSLPYVSKVYLSVINNEVVGDTFFQGLGNEFKLCGVDQYKTFKVKIYKREQNNEYSFNN